MSLNLHALLTAIAMVESGGNDHVVGAAGEVSRYQITPANWKTLTDIPIRRAVYEHEATIAATLNVQRIQQVLPKPIRQNPYWIAAAWNWGPGRTIEAWSQANGMPPRINDYAQRVINLYEFYTTQPPPHEQR